MDRRNHRLVALAITVAVAIAACGESAVQPIQPDPSATPGDSDLALVDLRYSCGSFPFRPDFLTAGPGTAELEATPVAEALRTHLALPGPDIDFLPDSGWHLVGMDLRSAEFVTVAGDLGMITVGLSNTGNGWKVTGWGDCQPRIVLPPGLASAEWAFDPDKPLPEAGDRTFDALVTEMACNSGEPADGRIVGPQLVKSADTILVIFAVRPRGGTQNCPSNPPTRIVVDLGEPLGPRRLLDGGRLPPGDPTQPRF